VELTTAQLVYEVAQLAKIQSWLLVGHGVLIGMVLYVVLRAHRDSTRMLDHIASMSAEVLRRTP